MRWFDVQFWLCNSCQKLKTTAVWTDRPRTGGQLRLIDLDPSGMIAQWATIANVNRRFHQVLVTNEMKRKQDDAAAATPR